ncbi:MAG: putative rane protein [Herbinix sp.]|jgi:hypothetical protein|nr:putative rane protein [Herbinix sp.]
MKSYLRGSLTVEAAFIMPIVLTVIMLLLYLAFYLHDTVRIQGAVNTTVYKAGMLLKHPMDITSGETRYVNMMKQNIFDWFTDATATEEEAISQYLEGQLSYGLFITKVNEIKVKVESTEVVITVSGNPKISLMGINKLWMSKDFILIQGKSEIHEPSDFVRIANVVMETGEKIKGMEDWKERISDLISTVR